MSSPGSGYSEEGTGITGHVSEQSLVPVHSVWQSRHNFGQKRAVVKRLHTKQFKRPKTNWAFSAVLGEFLGRVMFSPRLPDHLCERGSLRRLLLDLHDGF